jgi:two-component system sensor histidine kinase UhpB
MIARELHDELAQSVTAIRSMALAIVQVNDPKSEPAARLIAEEAARLYDAMHGLIPRLTPLVLDKFGLAEALGDLVERTQRAHAGLQIELKLDLADVKLPDDAALALYRAAQEGITNALRHGQARHLRLVLGKHDGRVELLLVDDGSGLEGDWSQRAGHYGLRWLTERVEALHGEVRVAAHAPHGVELRVTLPLEFS